MPSPIIADAVPGPARPTGLVTFLFTDIEGSTRLWEEHPAAMPAALARHDALLRANPVTLHDARISIAAGFRRDELPRFLGLDATEWDFRCRATLLGSYRMVAVRRA